MKLIIAIVSNDDAHDVQKSLIKANLFATRLSTTGSFLRANNSTFLIGVNNEKVPEVLDLIEKNSKRRTTIVPNTVINEFGALKKTPVEVEVGGATVFVVNVDQFIKI